MAGAIGALMFVVSLPRCFPEPFDEPGLLGHFVAAMRALEIPAAAKQSAVTTLFVGRGFVKCTSAEGTVHMLIPRTVMSRFAR